MLGNSEIDNLDDGDVGDAMPFLNVRCYSCTVSALLGGTKEFKTE